MEALVLKDGGARLVVVDGYVAVKTIAGTEIYAICVDKKTGRFTHEEINYLKSVEVDI